MAVPKTKVLRDRESTGHSDTKIVGALIERSNRVSDKVMSDITNLPEIKVFNDFVAVLLTPRTSTIALPGNSIYSNIGTIVGVGEKCTNGFKLGQNVVINAKSGAMAQVIDQDPAYDDKIVNLYQERNIFYTAHGGPTVIVK